MDDFVRGCPFLHKGQKTWISRISDAAYVPVGALNVSAKDLQPEVL